MWKRWCSTVALILLTTGALFPTTVLTWATGYLSKSYCRRYLSSDLTFQDIRWQGGMIVAQGGSLKREGIALATFETLTFKPSLKIRKRLCGGELQITKLKIWQNPTTQPLFLFKSSLPRHFLQPYLHICILDAALVKENSDKEIPLDLTFHMQAKDMLGHVTVHYADQPLELLLSAQEKKVELAVTFQHHPLVALQAICNLIVPALPSSLLPTWQIQNGEINGNFTACFEQQTMNHCQGNIQVSNLTAQYVDSHQRQCIPHCHMQFEIDQGELVYAELRGDLFGLQTDLLLDWSDCANLMQVYCEGPIDQLIPFTPYAWQAGITQAFGNQNLHLEGTLSRNHQGLEITGYLKDTSQHQCHFGCQLPTAPLVNSAFISKLRKQFCLCEGFLGWFSTKNMPVEQFLSPLLLGDSYLKLSGELDVEGSFNEQYISLFYQGQHVKLESQNFCLQIPFIQESGVHYFDLHSNEQVGYLPIQGASYEQKNCQFVMQDIKAVLRVEQKKLSFQHIATTWHGLPLQGQVDVHIHSMCDVDAKLSFGCTQGSLLAGQQLLQHFAQTPLDELSMRGTFCIDPLQTAILFHFTPKMEILQGKIHGNAFFELGLAVANIDAGKTSFVYDFCPKSLWLEHFQATTSLCGRSIEVVSDQCVMDPEKWTMTGLVKGIESQPLHLEVCWQQDIDVVAENLCIKGYVQDNCCFFDQIQWQQYQGTAELSSCSEGYRLNYLTLAHPKMGRCEISGLWDCKDKAAHGEVVLEALDLAQLLPTKTGPWGVVGTLSGKGKIDWTSSAGLCFTMQGGHRNLEFGSLQFGNSDELMVSYQSSRGFCLEGLEALGLYRLGALHYDPVIQRAYFDGFDFVLTSDKLPWLMEVASTLFAGKVYPSTLNFLSNLKQEDPLCGRLWIDLTPQNLWVHLQMQDGEYCFGQQLWNLRNFSLVYDPQEIHVKTGLLLGQVESCLHLTADSQYLSKGTLVLQQEQEDDLLTASWHQDPVFGYMIEDVQGSFAGISCSLSHVCCDRDTVTFDGSVSCQPQVTAALFSKGIQTWIQDYQLAGVCCLKGKFSFSKHDIAHPHFIGELIGNDLSYATVVLASVTCQCEMTAHTIELRNIAIRDWAGDLFCDHLRLFNQGGWQIAADHIALHDFRLSRLDSIWTKRERGDRPIFRSLFINTCEMHHVYGRLGDRNSLCAEGQVQFTHTVRRTLFSNLMLIPIEITARIGLDLSALIPAKGTIHYKVAEGKIHLTDFQDVYSDSKHSRFYLVENQPSYINLDGELNVHIKMKQYNLLMKLAELFNFTIKGTLCSPQYVFSSQDADQLL